MKRKLSFDGWLVIIILVLIIVIVVEVVLAKKFMKEKEETEVDEEAYFILYKGYEIAIGTGNQNPKDIVAQLDSSSENKYNTTYYNYENGLYKGETQGTFKYETSGSNEVKDVYKIAFSKKFNAIPRAYERLDTVPTKIKKELSDYDKVTADKIDLDGDGTKEYIVCVQSIKTDNNKPVAYSAIMLYSHDESKINDLVIVKDGVYSSGKSKTAKTLKDSDYTCLNLDMIEYIDLEDDNIMEMLIDVPQGEGLLLSIFNYSAYEVSGEQLVIDSINK